MTSPASVACDVMSRLSGLLTLIGTLSPSNVPDYVGPEDRPIVQTVIGNNDDDSDSGTHPFLGGMPIAQPPPLPLKTPKHGRKVSIVVPPVVSQPPEQQYDAVVMTAISKYYRFIHRTPIPANMPIGEQLCLYNTLGQVFLNQFSVKRVSALTQPAKM